MNVLTGMVVVRIWSSVHVSSLALIGVCVTMLQPPLCRSCIYTVGLRCAQSQAVGTRVPRIVTCLAGAPPSNIRQWHALSCASRLPSVVSFVSSFSCGFCDWVPMMGDTQPCYFISQLSSSQFQYSGTCSCTKVLISTELRKFLGIYIQYRCDFLIYIKTSTLAGLSPRHDIATHRRSASPRSVVILPLRAKYILFSYYYLCVSISCNTA